MAVVIMVLIAAALFIYRERQQRRYSAELEQALRRKHNAIQSGDRVRLADGTEGVVTYVGRDVIMVDYKIPVRKADVTTINLN